MATKSGFSSGWKGFVDHKWSKKRNWRYVHYFVMANALPRFAYEGSCSENFVTISPVGGNNLVWRGGNHDSHDRAVDCIFNLLISAKKLYELCLDFFRPLLG